MKSVLLSIKPKYCELIVSGQETVEIRKNRPKIDVPFKVYIYCTSSDIHSALVVNSLKTTFFRCCNYKTAIPSGVKIGNGKVIGEFVCNHITNIKVLNGGLVTGGPPNGCCTHIVKQSMLTPYEIKEYADGKAEVYGWHISDLVIYDKPKELSEFYYPPDRYCEKGLCSKCPLYETPGYEYGDVLYDCEWKKPLTRAPRSWCYVDTLEEVK